MRSALIKKQKRLPHLAWSSLFEYGENMKILIGTTNPAKVGRFAEFLKDCDVEFYTLRDLHITAEPDEKGNTPEENAIIKAKFYGQYFDKVICNDSGLYFDGLPLDDKRQPGLNIRTPNGEKRLDDEEMIDSIDRKIQSSCLMDVMNRSLTDKEKEVIKTSLIYTNISCF